MKRNFVILLCVLVFAACKKYTEAPQISSPAYIRVFNNLNSTVDFLHSQQATPFLTFLADPVMDASGIPADAAIVGDFLGTRQLFSLSYPINEGNSSVVNTGGAGGAPVLTTTNYEYPGNAHVLTAPVINGFDLSAWAQLASGRHRILFVVRPLNNIGFRDLSAAIRSQVLLDTTIDFQKGEVYTLEVVSRDLDSNRYGLYVRKEQFIHQAFEDDKLYAGFVNLSGKTPASAQVSQTFYYPDRIRISYSYNIYNDAASAAGGVNRFYYPLPGYDNNYYTTLSTKMDTAVSYLPLPLLPQSAFFYQGQIRVYNPLDGNNNNSQGTLPYFTFNLVDANNPINSPNVAPPLGKTLSCSADPAAFNNLVNSYPVTQGYLDLRFFSPNLNLIVNTGQAYHIYPTLNILEIVYDRVYLMQIQRGFDEVPKN